MSVLKMLTALYLEPCLYISIRSSKILFTIIGIILPFTATQNTFHFRNIDSYLVLVVCLHEDEMILSTSFDYPKLLSPTDLIISLLASSFLQYSWCIASFLKGNLIVSFCFGSNKGCYFNNSSIIGNHYWVVQEGMTIIPVGLSCLNFVRTAPTKLKEEEHRR